MPLDRGRTIGITKWDRAPHKSTYRPSASGLATANSHLLEACSLQVMNLYTQKLACHNKCRPWKGKEERSVTKVKHSHETAKNRQKSQALENKGNTWLAALGPHFQPELAHLLPPSQVCAQSISCCSLVEASGSSSLDDSSVNKTISRSRFIIGIWLEM